MQERGFQEKKLRAQGFSQGCERLCLGRNQLDVPHVHELASDRTGRACDVSFFFLGGGGGDSCKRIVVEGKNAYITLMQTTYFGLFGGS